MKVFIFQCCILLILAKTFYKVGAVDLCLPENYESAKLIITDICPVFYRYYDQDTIFGCTERNKFPVREAFKECAEKQFMNETYGNMEIAANICCDKSNLQLAYNMSCCAFSVRMPENANGFDLVKIGRRCSLNPKYEHHW